ncbi:WXG100 family type VII secretion target [Nocardia sp. 004]|uniref:WXG100 family type VII secretion target n=1 Tax=Nocardia sp. 004 TaxID=3385978 RepID=UPI0039A3B488
MSVPVGTESSLRAKIDEIESNISEINDLPQRVQAGFGELVKVVRIVGHTGSILNPFGYFVTEEIVDKIWENRDKIHEAMGKIIEKLGEFLKGIAVPITFINYADEWRNIQGAFDDAHNEYGYTSLRSDWQGIAADRYRDMREIHDSAYTAMSAMCAQVSENLESIAVSTLELYSDIAANTFELVSNTQQSLADIASQGPLAVLETDELVTIVLGLQKFILDNVSDVMKTAQKLMIAGNRIAQATSVQDGIPNNRWPSAVTGRVVTNGVVENPGEVYDDGTVTDGNNKWSVKTDRITQ